MLLMNCYIRNKLCLNQSASEIRRYRKDRSYHYCYYHYSHLPVKLRPVHCTRGVQASLGAAVGWRILKLTSSGAGGGGDSSPQKAVDEERSVEPARPQPQPWPRIRNQSQRLGRDASAHVLLGNFQVLVSLAYHNTRREAGVGQGTALFFAGSRRGGAPSPPFVAKVGSSGVAVSVSGRSRFVRGYCGGSRVHRGDHGSLTTRRPSKKQQWSAACSVVRPLLQQSALSRQLHQ